MTTVNLSNNTNSFKSEGCRKEDASPTNVRDTRELIEADINLAKDTFIEEDLIYQGHTQNNKEVPQSKLSIQDVKEIKLPKTPWVLNKIAISEDIGIIALTTTAIVLSILGIVPTFGFSLFGSVTAGVIMGLALTDLSLRINSEIRKQQAIQKYQKIKTLVLKKNNFVDNSDESFVTFDNSSQNITTNIPSCLRKFSLGVDTLFSNAEYTLRQNAYPVGLLAHYEEQRSNFMKKEVASA